MKIKTIPYGYTSGLCDTASQYFEDSHNRKSFEKRYLANYRKPYQWQYIRIGADES